MKRIIINTAITNLKKKKHHVNFDSIQEEYPYEENDEQEPGTPGGSEITNIDKGSLNAETIKQYDFSREELKEILKEIPLHYQIVFNLHVIDGLKHKEISRILDIEINNSKARLRRAKQHIQSRLYERCRNKLKNKQNEG